MNMANTVEKKTINELESMHTGSLLSRRKALLKCDECFEMSDELIAPVNDLIQFKNTDVWKQAYRELQEVLSERENIPGKKERAILRKKNKGR